jgi:hypothetical protein
MKSFRIRFDELTDSQIKEVYFTFRFCRENFEYDQQTQIYEFLKRELNFLGEDFLNSLDEIYNDEASYNNVYTSIDFTRLNLYPEMAERFYESL